MDTNVIRDMMNDETRKDRIRRDTRQDAIDTLSADITILVAAMEACFNRGGPHTTYRAMAKLKATWNVELGALKIQREHDK